MNAINLPKDTSASVSSSVCPVIQAAATQEPSRERGDLTERTARHLRQESGARYGGRVADEVVVGIVLLRFVAALFIPKFPLPAVIASLIIDAADQTIFQFFTPQPRFEYQSYDKALDVFYLAIAYISTMRTWRDPVAFQIVRFLFLFRLVGVLLFELLDRRWLLLVFPNTFEYFFIVYELVRTRWQPRRLSATALVGTAAFIWFVIKSPQEWWIHVAQLDFTSIISNYPLMWGALAALMAIATVVSWICRGRIPAADWPFTMNVDRHLPRVKTTHQRISLLDPVFIEKVILLSLVCVILAQALPDIGSSNVAMLLDVAVLVVLNSLVSELFYRCGHSWGTTLKAFLSTLAINIGIVSADSLLSRRDVPPLYTLFFVLHVSLLLALFDRYRSTRGADDLRTSALAAWRAERERKRGCGGPGRVLTSRKDLG